MSRGELGDAVSTEELRRRALRLEYATVGWNAGEAVLTVSLGVAAGSLALVGFGTDSLVEIFASGVVIWHERAARGAARPGRTRRALRLVALAFLVLAIALGTFAARDLLTGREAGTSPVGIAYLAVTAAVMFALAVAKRRIAERLGSAPLRSEAAMTFLDGVLATLTLTGLAANAAFGWWWADPGAALLVAAFALNEARENWAEAAEMDAGG